MTDRQHEPGHAAGTHGEAFPGHTAGHAPGHGKEHHPHPVARGADFERTLEALLPYAPHAAIGLGVLFALYVVGQIWGSWDRSRQATAWGQYLIAEEAVADPLADSPFAMFMPKPPEPGRGLDKLADVAARYESTVAGQWAKIGVADLKQAAALDKLFSERSKAIEELVASRKLYDEVRTTASGWGSQAAELLLQRAILGSAVADESLGEVAAAKLKYKDLASRWPAGPYAMRAKARENALSGEREVAVAKFYEEVEKYQPIVPGTPGVKPAFDTTLTPGSFPAPPTSTGAPVATSTAEPKTTSPETTAAPASTTPAGTAPAGSAPAAPASTATGTAPALGNPAGTAPAPAATSK